MFYQFQVNEQDRNFLKFLWREDGETIKPPLEYRMTVHLFGAVLSPGCASYGLKHLATLYEREHPSAAKFILEQFYVDDGLTSASTKKEAIHLINEARELCKIGGLRLHKFLSSHEDVLKTVPPSERADEIEQVDLGLQQSETQKALGIIWDLKSDILNFQSV